MQDARYKMGVEMQVSGVRFQDARCRMQDAGRDGRPDHPVTPCRIRICMDNIFYHSLGVCRGAACSALHGNERC